MQYSSKTAEFAPADFPLQIIGLKIDCNQLLLAKSELFEGRNSKNGEINVFLDCFQLILMGFLTTSLHKNSQNDVKLLETWWFWHTLVNGTHIYWNQKHPDFHLKSPWTPMSKLSPVCNSLFQLAFQLLWFFWTFTLWINWIKSYFKSLENSSLKAKNYWDLETNRKR